MEKNQIDNTDIPIEKLLRMAYLEQYVNDVVDYTQQYNNENSIHYSPHNLIGSDVKYPLYGDFPEAYSLRKYGKWWKRSENFQCNYRSSDFDALGVEDYVIVEFESSVLPREIVIYEIYNPGAVVRIWAKNVDSHWMLLWEHKPEICPPVARKFSPKIKKINYLINTLKIEFSLSHLSYHTSIEAILLAGYEPNTTLQRNILTSGLFMNTLTKPNDDNNFMEVNNTDVKNGKNYFDSLPYEVILHIFQYLDLKSLSKCAKVNKRWNQATDDPFLYQNLNFRPYWNLVNCNTLRYFGKKCKGLRKLDLSWCGNNIAQFSNEVTSIIKTNCKTLTHISLGNCKFLTPEMFTELLSCQELMELRLNYSNAYSVTNEDNNINFSTLLSLTKMTCLDLTATHIKDDDLILMLKEYPNLQHIILDLCENLIKLDEVVEVIVNYNKKLRTWSSWKTSSLTANGINLFGKCPNIRELDLGWCLANKDPENCLKFIAKGCPFLKRLIITEWRGINDQQLFPIIINCKELTQLDFLGLLNITPEVCEKALVLLPKLRLLDISYCENIRPEEVEIWRQQYPHITIQR